MEGSKCWIVQEHLNELSNDDFNTVWLFFASLIPMLLQTDRRSESMNGAHARGKLLERHGESAVGKCRVEYGECSIPAARQRVVRMWT